MSYYHRHRVLCSFLVLNRSRFKPVAYFRSGMTIGESPRYCRVFPSVYRTPPRRTFICKYHSCAETKNLDKEKIYFQSNFRAGQLYSETKIQI